MAEPSHWYATHRVPVRRTGSTTATPGPSPAASPTRNDSTAARRSCTIETREKARNWFRLVLFTTYMRQRWEYDGRRVYPERPHLRIDKTRNGWAWAWHGVVYKDDYFTDDSLWAHVSDRVSLWRADVPHFGGQGTNVRTVIVKAGNGDWATGNDDTGLPGCGDDD